MSVAETRRAVLLAGLLVGGAALVPAAAATRGPCSTRLPGGEWPTYGQSLAGQQRQDAERRLGPATVAGLVPVWRAESTAAQSAPPIVAGGCVFLNADGAIEARELRTGRVVWRTSGTSTAGTFAPTVVDGRVHYTTAEAQRPRAVAVSASTGRELWTSEEITFGSPTNQMGSAIVWRGVQLVFTTGPDNDVEAKQGFALVDARTGAVLRKSLTLPQADRDAGLVGGGAWGTPTVDTRTGYAYVGTSNPESKQGESDYDNAIVKVDLDRRRRTFGTVVGTYKGTPDSVTGYDNPVCQAVGGDLWYNAGTYGGSPSCGQIDVDFGVGPTLWRDRNGRLLGAATQKSGVLHVFDATTMQPVWTKQLFVTLSFLGGNIARIATDGTTLYVAANPGVLHALDASNGASRWVQPLPGVPMKGGNVVLAGGVVHYVDELRARAFDAATGGQLWQSPPEAGASIGSALAVAGGHLVVNHYGVVVAYRLPVG